MPQSIVRQHLSFAVVTLLLAGLWQSVPVRAQAQLAALPVVKPVVDCGKLAGIDLSAAVGSPTHVLAATSIADGSPAPYCRVTGYVEPRVNFEVRLPLSTWTQRFVQTGCGGLCGMLNIRLEHEEGCYPTQHGEVVLSSTDMGHSGGMDGKFGEKDYQLRVDFAYRGVHVTTLATKALIAAFYGQAQRYSYFAGCSDGGREALMEAQRYPGDFNGITAGAPAMNFTTQNTFYHGWNTTKNLGADGLPVLTSAQLPTLHRAALEACDAADGLKDGLISDPLHCHVDPAVVECKPGADPAGCLTHAQVEVARAIYQGAHTASGEQLVLSGPLPGSELAWAGVYIAQPGQTQVMSSMISNGTLKYLAYEQNPGPAYTVADLQYTATSFKAIAELHALYDATDPDLTPFQKAGGKLILWHGLADPHISPLNTIAYYTAMGKIMGAPSVQSFARLYLFPGGYHCGGGEGPFDFDLLTSIMLWTENGTAPGALVAAHKTGGGRQGPPARLDPPGAANGIGEPPRGPDVRSGNDADAPAKVDRTRPVYPYPYTAQYKGTGAIDEAESFSIGPARPLDPARLLWLGAGFYTPHYERWCKGTGTALTCTAHRD